MKTFAPISIALLLFTTALWTCIPAAAQTVQRRVLQFDRSKQISAEALKNSQAGDSRKAIQVAQAGLQECPAGGSGSACRGLLNYTLGYIFQRQAQDAATPSDRDRALNSAAASYKATLEDDPSNSSVRYNLALLLSDSGDQNGAIAELQHAVQADPNQWQYSLKLGDLYARQKNWKGAMLAYEQATKIAPLADAPSERILELTRRGYGLSTNEMLSRCKEWQVLHPSLAPNCYEQVMTMLHASDNAAAEAALVTWLDLIARQEKIDDHLLEELPQDWGTAALPPLRAVLRGDLSGVADNWWTRSGPQSEAWARFLLAVGQQSSDFKTMERSWQTALSIVKYDHGSAASLEIRRALALLYVRHPDLDPTQSKLNQLVEEIFEGKMGAIQSKDLEAEQRYHTVLGLIFAGQQKWGSDDDAHRAAFQLKRTVEVAEERYQKEGIYQPLPEIKELRVTVYEKTNRPAEATKARWEAILAYMDTDQLDRAGLGIEAFHSSDGFDKATLSSVLKLRRDAAAPTAERMGALITELAALGPKAGISLEFLRRQQFKALGDLVTASSAGTAKTESLQAAMKAFSLAVEQHVSLIGVNDLSRWQAVQQKLVNTVGAGSEAIQVRPGGAGGTAVLKLALPGSTISQSVEVTSQTFQAAQVAQVLGPEKLSQYDRSLTLANGKLTAPDTTVVSPEMRQKLEMKGIKVMAVPQ